MKYFKILPYIFILGLLTTFGCQDEEGPDVIYAYFPEKSTSLVENSGQAVKIPVKVFAMADLTENVVLSYTISGNGANRVQDKTGGSITVEKGYAAYIVYIELSPVDNNQSDGDTELTLNIQSSNPSLVVGLGSDNLNSSMIVNVLDDDIACLAELWKGPLKCTDNIYESYSPESCTGALIDNNCQKVMVSFDFWAMSSLPVRLELQLGDIDPATKKGKLTLLKDYSVEGGGYNIAFYAGDAGTFDVNTFELKLVLSFSGYDIGGDGKYRFTIKK